MALAIGDIVELVGPDRAVRLARRQLFGEPAGIFHVVVGVLVGHGRDLDQLGAGQPQHVLLLVRLGVGDDDDGLQTQGVADQRQTDAGIAGGALDHRAARLEPARIERIADDEQRGAVLDRLAGIHELGLAEDGAAGLLRGALELDQRGIADRLDNAVAVGHGGPSGLRGSKRTLMSGRNARKTRKFQGSRPGGQILSGRPVRLAAGNPNVIDRGSKRRATLRAGVVELVDTPDLGSGGFGRGGSTPSARTIQRRWLGLSESEAPSGAQPMD